MILPNFQKMKLKIKKKNIQNNEKTLVRGNEIILNKYFNINVKLQKALEIEVKVVIKKEAVLSYDHSKKVFDIENLMISILNNQQ